MEYMCPFCHKQSFVELIDKPLAVMKLQCCHCLKISSLRHDHFAIDNSAYHSTFQCLSCHQTTDISHYEYRLYQNCDVVCATCGEKMTLIKPDSSSHVGLFCTLFLCNGLTIGVLFMWLTEKRTTLLALSDQPVTTYFRDDGLLPSSHRSGFRLSRHPFLIDARDPIDYHI